MKKIFASLNNGIIDNICKFKCDATLPHGWADVTGKPRDIGWPVVDGEPVPKPSKWHTLDGTEWILTPENQVLKDDAETPLTDGEQYDRAMRSNKLVKAVVLALNDRSFIPGKELSNSELKNIIKSKL